METSMAFFCLLMTSQSVSKQVSEWEEARDKKDPSWQAIDDFFSMVRWRKGRRIAGEMIRKDGWKMGGWCNGHLNAKHFA